ncbi:hypothetical protein BGZ81_005223 [Podila clonocystis]|nr:hypothetical protein BGZ81_005223 [Podila clonocystis]
MQIKSLVIASVAVAAVSAQQFANNTCTQCVFASFPKDSECAKLSADQAKTLTGIFANNSVNVGLLNQLVKEPVYQSCLCHWSVEGWAAGGAVSSCISGAAAVCNAADIKAAEDGIKPLAPILKCSALKPNGTSPSATGTGTAPAPSTSNKPSAANINIPYALTVAAFGLVALVGF